MHCTVRANQITSNCLHEPLLLMILAMKCIFIVCVCVCVCVCVYMCVFVREGKKERGTVTQWCGVHMSVCVFTQPPAGVVPPVWVVSLSIKSVLTPFSFVFTCLHEAKSAWSASGAFYQGCQKRWRLQFYVGNVCVYVRVCVCVCVCIKGEILCLLRVRVCERMCVSSYSMLKMMWPVSMLWFPLFF